MLEHRLVPPEHSTCNTCSTLLATVTTDPTGTATYDWVTSGLATGSYHICAFSAAMPPPTSNLPYTAASSGSQTLTVGTAANFMWTTAPPASETYIVPNATFTPVAHTTDACGTISYGVTGGCTISRSNLVTMTSGTNACVVTASLSACTYRGTNYAPATLTATVAVQQATQATLVLTGVPATTGNGATFTVGTTGGSGTGAVTFNFHAALVRFQATR